MKTQDRMNLANIAKGAVNEAFEIEFEKAIKNILDPNTEPKKARKIVVEIVLKPDQKRNHVSLICQAKSTLVPAAGIETSLLIGTNRHGDVIAQELMAQAEGQLEVDRETGEIREVGTRIEFKKAVEG